MSPEDCQRRRLDQRAGPMRQLIDTLRFWWRYWTRRHGDPYRERIDPTAFNRTLRDRRQR